MRLLLDTQIALWALVDDPRLGQKARDLILDSDNEINVSTATVWEVAIKHGLGRGDMPVSGARAAKLFSEAGYRELPVTWKHAALVDELPAIHGDPFDRILVAQSLAEPMRLVTRDKTISQYNDTIILA